MVETRDWAVMLGRLEDRLPEEEQRRIVAELLGHRREELLADARRDVKCEAQGVQ